MQPATVPTFEIAEHLADLDHADDLLPCCSGASMPDSAAFTSSTAS